MTFREQKTRLNGLSQSGQSCPAAHSAAPVWSLRLSSYLDSTAGRPYLCLVTVAWGKSVVAVTKAVLGGLGFS